jgi:hypothetical protein
VQRPQLQLPYRDNVPIAYATLENSRPEDLSLLLTLGRSLRAPRRV